MLQLLSTLLQLQVWSVLVYKKPSCLQGDKQSGCNDSGSTSAGQSPRLKSFACRSLLAKDVSDTATMSIYIPIMAI